MCEEDTVTVELPPCGQCGRVARTITAACCAVEGLSVDTMADARLLVDEVFHALTSIAAGPIRMLLTPRCGRVLLRMSAAPWPGCDWATVRLSPLEAMAAVMASDPVFDRDEEHVRFTAVLRERRAQTL